MTTQRGLSVWILTQDLRFGGGGARIANAAVHLLRAGGHEARVVMLSTVGHPRLSVRRSRAPTAVEGVDAIPGVLPETQVLPVLIARRQLRVFASSDESPPDAILVTGGSVHHAFAAIGLGIPTVAWAGTTLEAERRFVRAHYSLTKRMVHQTARPLLAHIERASAEGVTMLLSQSEQTADDFRAVGRDSTAILYPPVAPRWFLPSLPVAQPRERTRLAFVGRASDRRKRFDRVLVLAARLAAIQSKEVELVATVTEELLGRFTIPTSVRVTALGHPADDELHRALQTADWLVLTSEQEGFGIVVAEAMAAALPVASTPCGGPECVIRNSGCGVISEFDTLADQIAAVDRFKRLEMAANGRSFAEEHLTYNHAAARLNGFLSEVVTGRRRLDL